MPQTAAKVTHFVYADDPRRIVPPSDATIENWHAGRLIPAFDADHRPTCELSRRPIEQPIVAYSPSGQQSMEDIQMYSDIEWEPRLFSYDTHADVRDPQRGYIVRPAAGVQAPIIVCQPLPFASPPPPGRAPDPLYEECMHALTALFVRETIFKKPIEIRRCLRQCLHWRALRGLLHQVPWTPNTLVPEVLVFDAVFPHIINVNTVGVDQMYLDILRIANPKPHSIVTFHDRMATGHYRYLITSQEDEREPVCVVCVQRRPHPTFPLLAQHWMDLYMLDWWENTITQPRPQPPYRSTHAPHSDPDPPTAMDT